MAKPKDHHNQDLFESGRSQLNNLFGSESPPTNQSNFGGGFGSPPPHGDPGYSLMPYEPPQQTPASSSPFSKIPINEIKQFVDRMGGVEGIMNSFSKMNAFMKNVQQMAPMLKLLMGSFTGKASTNGSSSSTRRRRRKRTSYGYSSGRRRTNKARRRSSGGYSSKSGNRRTTSRRRRPSSRRY